MNIELSTVRQALADVVMDHGLVTLRRNELCCSDLRCGWEWSGEVSKSNEGYDEWSEHVADELIKVLAVLGD